MISHTRPLSRPFSPLCWQEVDTCKLWQNFHVAGRGTWCGHVFRTFSVKSMSAFHSVEQVNWAWRSAGSLTTQQTPTTTVKTNVGWVIQSRPNPSRANERMQDAFEVSEAGNRSMSLTERSVPAHCGDAPAPKPVQVQVVCSLTHWKPDQRV